MPATRPATIAMKISAISFAVPGAERNRTRLNAPAVATPAPMLPFTIMMVTHTSAGSAASVARKLWERPERREAVSAMPAPIASATATHSRKSVTEMTVMAEESKSPLNIVSSIAPASIRIFRAQHLLIGGPVF